MAALAFLLPEKSHAGDLAFEVVGLNDLHLVRFPGVGRLLAAIYLLCKDGFTGDVVFFQNIGFQSIPPFTVLSDSRCRPDMPAVLSATWGQSFLPSAALRSDTLPPVQSRCRCRRTPPHRNKAAPSPQPPSAPQSGALHLRQEYIMPATFYPVGNPGNALCGAVKADIVQPCPITLLYHFPRCGLRTPP